MCFVEMYIFKCYLLLFLVRLQDKTALEMIYLETERQKEL